MKTNGAVASSIEELHSSYSGMNGYKFSAQQLFNHSTTFHSTLISILPSLLFIKQSMGKQHEMEFFLKEWNEVDARQRGASAHNQPNQERKRN